MRSTQLSYAFLLVLLASCGGDPVPARIFARVEPARLWYHTDQDVVLTGFVTDVLGESISNVEVRWTVEPASAASPGANEDDPRKARFTLRSPGTATFTGCVVPADETLEPTLCDSITLRIDDGMPSLELETPLPGAELDDPGGRIVVRGSVADRSVVRVYVNGTGAEPDDLGQFEITVPAEFGINHLVVDASDGLTEVSQVQLDVIWAPSYLPALSEDGRPEVTLPNGVMLRLGQSFFDDGVPLDTTVTPIETRDLADLLELVVTELDIASFVPDPVVDSSTLTLSVRSLDIGTPHVAFDVTDEGAELFLRIAGISATTSGALTIDEATSLSLDGTIRASAIAYASLAIRKESEEAELEVTLGDVVVGLERLEGTFEDPETQAIFQVAGGVLGATLETVLLDTIRETLESSVPQILRDALSAIDEALAGQSVTLDSEPFPSMTIGIDARMGSLTSAYRRDVLATLRTTIGTDVASLHPDSRGVARLDDGTTEPRFFRDGALSLGVRLAVLNGLLHTLWSSGLLELDVSTLLPDAISGLVREARIEGRLPPVLRPPRVGETDDLVLSVGQLELELVVMGQPARFGLSIEAGVSLDVSEGRVALSIADTPRIVVWEIVEAADPRLLSAQTIQTLLTSLWPDLRAAVADGIAFELPIPALGDFGGLAPSLAGLTLQLESTDRIRARGDVLVLDARLLGRLRE